MPTFFIFSIFRVGVSVLSLPIPGMLPVFLVVVPTRMATFSGLRIVIVRPIRGILSAFVMAVPPRLLVSFFVSAHLSLNRLVSNGCTSRKWLLPTEVDSETDSEKASKFTSGVRLSPMVIDIADDSVKYAYQNQKLKKYLGTLTYMIIILLCCHQ